MRMMIQEGVRSVVFVRRSFVRAREGEGRVTAGERPERPERPLLERERVNANRGLTNAGTHHFIVEFIVVMEMFFSPVIEIRIPEPNMAGVGC